MKYCLLFAFTLMCLTIGAHPKKIPIVSAGSAKIQATPQDLTPPEFPGGQGALFNYVMKDLKWPKMNKADSLQEIILTFYVEKDGSLTDIKVVKSLAPSFDAEVVNMLRKSPKWIPAKCGEQPIKSKYDLPIRYHSEYEN